MRFSALLYFYARRLRTRSVQELLAGVGIALGVALVFAVQVANDSITKSSGEIVRTIAGPATLQMRARSADGFDEALTERVRQLPGVVRAAALLELSATIVGPRSRHVTVQLASTTPTLGLLDGLLSKVPLSAAAAEPGVMLPSTTAHALGLSATLGHAIEGPPPHVTLNFRGRASSVKVTAILGSETIGALASASAAIAPLSMIQDLAGLPGRVTRILVQSAPGREALVHKELMQVTADRLTVAPANQDVTLLTQALRPNAQATGFFALVSGLVGLLIAFNAMLLTAPERRRMISDLRIQGYRRWQLVQMLLFQAVCLGVAASLAGLMVGWLLSRGAFHETPNYLAPAFPLGSQTVIGLRPLLISFLGGVLATCLATAPPLFDLRRSRAVDGIYFEDGEPGHALGIRTRIWMLAGGVVLVAGTSGLLRVKPGAAIVATVGLAMAMLLAIPAIFTAAVWAADSLASRTDRLNMLIVAARALRSTTLRSLALAATGAIAIFGSVVADSSHQDLLNGLYRDYGQYVRTANIWVTNNNDDLATMNFPTNGLPRRIASLRDVAEVRPYQGGYLDVDGRRVWIIARSPAVRDMIPSSQILDGNQASATALLRAGGWITISQQLAAALHTKIRGSVVLPTPTGQTTYKVAAITTNLGWSAGAIVLTTSDYRHAWASADPSALEVDIRHGSNPQLVRQEIAHSLGPNSGLEVQTSAQRAATADGLARQGLNRLSQISLLLVVIAALAMAAAMAAAIWQRQRRRSLASLRVQSYQPRQLRGMLLCETGLVLGASCLVGALAGAYGHLLADRYLMLATGFPTSLSVQGSRAMEILLLVLAAALVVLAIPGYLASQTPPSMALEAP
jgi:putative ABC transport system permease protein